MLYIYCSGTLSSEIVDIALRCKYTSGYIRFVDDTNYGKKDIFENKILDFQDLLNVIKDKDKIIIANGEPFIRARIFEKLKIHRFNFETLIDPAAIVSSSSEIGEGSIVYEFCSLSSNTQISENVLINRQSIIGHDIKIGCHSVISSTVNLGGAVKVGKLVYIGMGALVKENINIKDKSIVSMGSVVHRDVLESVIVVGNPARVSKRNEEMRVFKKHTE